jgi:hypothetical protein
MPAITASGERDDELQGANGAAKRVLSPPAAANRTQSRLDSVQNPALGALVVAPDHDLIIRKAIMREVRRIKLRLFLRKLSLQIAYFALKARRSALLALH